MDIIKCVEKAIIKHNLIQNGDRVLVALSGGSDSITLLFTLNSLKDKLGITLGACHVNHMLRDSADRDMQFCNEVCKRLGIEFHILKKDIKTESKKHGKSEELYAREVRYNFFKSLNYDKIATAHNKNDNAETILHNFMRGSSLQGLSGIPYKRGNIVRPLLDITKQEINTFCKEMGIDFVLDETNLKPIYTRNKIRLNLIPEIEENFNPNFINTVTSNSVMVQEDCEYLDNIAKSSYTDEILVDDVSKYPASILRRMIELHYKKSANSDKNLSGLYIYNIIDLLKSNETGKQIDLPNYYSAYISYGKLIIEKKTKKLEFEYKIIPNVPLCITEIGKEILLKEDKNGKIFLDTTDNLIIRNKRNGDIFYPTKMSGKKKLSDFFTDKKIPKKEREQIPLLLSNSKIVSVIGYRNDRNFENGSGKQYKIIVKEI